MDKSFTYMICSDERKNVPVAGQPLFYRIDFGGFNEQYDSYNCEVISFALGGVGLVQTQNHIFFCVEGLGETGYYCKSRLNNNDTILSVVAMSLLSELLTSNERGHTTFRVNNCRTLKEVVFYFLKADLTPVLAGQELQNGGETRWALTLKMTPIIE